MHRGCDENYLDRNYAGAFIVWDRLYGAFQEGGPTCGVTKPLASWNPLWANVHYYAYLVEMSRWAPNFREKLKCGSRPGLEARVGAEDPAGGRKPARPQPSRPPRRRAPRGLTGYAVVHFRLLIVFTVGLLSSGNGNRLSWGRWRRSPW